jgi:hypothetical protein
MSTLRDLEGQDAYDAARRFRERYRGMIRSGHVDEAPRGDAPAASADPSELERGEGTSRVRTPEEERLLRDTRDK